jgi:hypothetical protein
VIYCAFIADAYRTGKWSLPSRGSQEQIMVALLRRPENETLRLPLEDRWDTSVQERRAYPRRHASGWAVGRRIDHCIQAQRQPRVSLTLRDLSDGGLLAQADVPLMVGERLNVSFPASGIRGGSHVPGRVRRCRPSGMGYRVAIEFDPTPSAA